MDCIFCKIGAGEIASNLIYEDDRLVAFEDLDPQAPTHILIIPKKHIESLDQIKEADKELFGHLMYVAAQIAREQNLSQGYRLVNNCGSHGGQTVDHIHYHLLGGRELQWPPG